MNGIYQTSRQPHKITKANKYDIQLTYSGGLDVVVHLMAEYLTRTVFSTRKIC